MRVPGVAHVHMGFGLTGRGGSEPRTEGPGNMNRNRANRKLHTQRVLSTYMVECRVSILGTTIII